MTKPLLLSLLAGALFLAGCVVEEPHPHRTVVVREAPPRTVVVKQNPAHTVVVTPNGAYDYHCPPGQRKKGRC